MTLTTSISDCLLLSPEVVIRFENLDTGRDTFLADLSQEKFLLTFFVCSL